MSRRFLVDARSAGPNQVTVGMATRRPQVTTVLGTGGGIPGPPGPPFRILGSKDSVGELPVPGEPGTGWLIDGDLWVWV